VERRSRKRSSNVGGEKIVIGKNGEVLFDRPKPTVSCSSNGRRKRRRRIKVKFPLKGVIT
jgi:hypothetical protein